ncbi:hypothetical protein Ae201684P_001361 [Aphanomyces euteiches]|nr:hypothetical protein Ae201684P_001361 [Aphanomyces euteiches]
MIFQDAAREEGQDGPTERVDYAMYLAKKRLLEDVAYNRYHFAADETRSVKDDRRCDFEIVDITFTRRKQQTKPVQEDEERDKSELSVHLEGLEQDWKGHLKIHKKQILHEIWTDPRDPAMGRMLAAQKITNIQGHNLIDRINAAMDAMARELFENVKATYSKIYQNGMFTTDQTITRLLSSFKIEMRNVITCDSVRQKVLLECMEEVFGASEQHMGSGMTLQRFKLEALERMLESRNMAPNSSRDFNERRFQAVCDQIEEFVWSTQSLNSDASVKTLRKILTLICRIPFLELVPLPFKAEMAKSSVLRHMGPNEKVVCHDVIAQNIFMLLEGRVDSTEYSQGAMMSRGADDYVVVGDVDVILSQTGGVDVVTATPVTVAVLSKHDTETILKQSFHPTSLLDKSRKGHNVANLHLAARPHKKLNHSPDHIRPSNSMGHIAKVAKALRPPRFHREHVKQARCASSRQFTQSYIQSRREAEAQTNDTTANLESPSSNNESLSHKDSNSDSGPPLADQEIAETKTDLQTTTRPPFEFFPSFPDRFHVDELTILFMSSRPFPMDAMRLTDIGPPCPESPSFVIPPRVQIDTAVLLMDQLQLLCKSSGGIEARRHSLESVMSHSMVSRPLDQEDDEQLEALAPLSLIAFADGRKKVTAAAVKGQKAPFASVSLFCPDWSKPIRDYSAPSSEERSPLEDDVAWLAAATQAVGDDDDNNNQPTKAHSPVKVIQQPLDTTTSENSSDISTKPLTYRKDNMSSSPSRAKLRAMSVEPERIVEEQNQEECADESAHKTFETAEIASTRLFIADVHDNPILNESDVDNDTKHVFKIESKRESKTIREPSRRLTPDASSAEKSLTRKDVYRKVVKQITQSAPSEMDPNQHLKQLEIEEKLQEELGKATLEEGKPCPWRIKLQQRMETVLTALELSARKKLQIVMKYTQTKYSSKLEGALDLWEKAVNCIMDREATLKRVYEFELVASDPRRLFQTISTLRLKEQRQRDRLFLLLNNHTKFCKAILEELNQKYHDVIFYRDRPYLAKMEHDYTELLYDLEQVRIRTYFGGVNPIVPVTEDASLDPTLETQIQHQSDALQLNSPCNVPPTASSTADVPISTNTQLSLPKPRDSTSGFASPNVAISVEIKRQNNSSLIYNKEGYHGHLKRIVKERGDAALQALKDDLHRKHLEEIAAQAQEKLELAQEKINRRRQPTRPPQPKPKQKSMQESLAEMLGKLRPTKPQ